VAPLAPRSASDHLPSNITNGAFRKSGVNPARPRHCQRPGHHSPHEERARPGPLNEPLGCPAHPGKASKAASSQETGPVRTRIITLRGKGRGTQRRRHRLLRPRPPSTGKDGFFAQPPHRPRHRPGLSCHAAARPRRPSPRELPHAQRQATPPAHPGPPPLAPATAGLRRDAGRAEHGGCRPCRRG
jgi:hypothetical protein